MRLNLMRMVVFLVVFLSITVGVPFVLATFLPTASAVLGSLGVSVLAGLILFFVLAKIGKDASPS